MGGLYDFLTDLKQGGQAAGQFLGLLNILIGRRIQKEDGSLISSGVTWRELSFALKKARWDKETVSDLGIDPSELPPRDRQRFWYAAIVRAGVDSPRAAAAGDRLAELLRRSGYRISEAPPSTSEKRR
jgi:hypothetical protein